MKIFINKHANYYAPIKYVLKIIEKNRDVSFSFENDVKEAQIIWDHENKKSEYFNLEFYKDLEKRNNLLKHKKIFENSPIIEDKRGNKDIISTIFYLVNCLQELNPLVEELDQFKRFKYISSYQYKFGNIEENIVEKLIDSFCNKHQIEGNKKRSRFFISHDIDTIYGSFLQDGFWAFKKMKIGVILNLIIIELIRKPSWRNIDKIIKINDEFDVKSTFFWLVNKGIGNQGIKNADYKINKEKKLLKLVEQSNNTNGLHKSCCDISIDNELKKGKLSPYNRYHFLNFQTHRDWKLISDSKLKLDCSLGFAEHYGFRNSYGKAFQPFDVFTNKPFDFIEAPLNFMDTTFHKYMKTPVKNIGNIIIDFYQKHNTNCDFSLLWHNTYFTNYKYGSFINQYKKVISFIYDSNIELVTPEVLIEENKIKW